MSFAHHPDTRKVRDSACALYEPETGQIRHMLLTVVREGGHDPSEAETEAMAHASLERRGKPHAHLLALHVPHDSVQPYTRYRVDVKGKRLVEAQPADKPTR
jgi:hypothetical protein